MEPAALLQEFLIGNTRQRQRLWKTLPSQAPELIEAIWALLSSQSRQADDWAIGSLLRLLGADPDQLAKLQATYPQGWLCLLYTSPSPRDATLSRMPSSA